MSKRNCRPTYFPLILLLVFAFTLTIATSVRCADWPMWRCDASRSGNSSEELPSSLHLGVGSRAPGAEAGMAGRSGEAPV